MDLTEFKPSPAAILKAKRDLAKADDSRHFIQAVCHLLLATVPADSWVVTTWNRTVDPRVLFAGSRNGVIPVEFHQPVALRSRLQIERGLEDPTLNAIRADAGVPASNVMRAVSLLLHEGDTRSPSLMAFSLERGAGSPGFSEHEIARLVRHHIGIARAANRVGRIETERRFHRGLERVVRDLTDGVVLANEDCEVCFDNRVAEETNGERKTLPKLPREIADICEDLRKVWLSSQFPSSRKARKRLVWKGAEATVELIAPNPAERGGPVFLIKFRSEAASRGNSSVLAADPFLLAQLSPREKEIARLAALGMSNSGIANVIGRSVATVKTTLHSIFGKLDVSSRSQLVILLLG